MTEVRTNGATDAEVRVERDTMGEVQVPAWALWGASTQRAVDNFPVSGIRFSRPFIRALGLVKQASAEVNAGLGHLDAEISRLISAAAGQVADGGCDVHFPLDVFQTGSGTSTNTNANEVIANIANRQAGSPLGTKTPVHPNDHVNFGQSSNDVIPTCIHISALDVIDRELLPSLGRLQASLEAKAAAFDDVVKTGRTHLMDATPVTLGQEFSGYARAIELGIDRVRTAIPRLGELALGGTAVGTGINTDPDFAKRVISLLAERTGLDLREATNHFEAQGAQDACVEMSGALKTVAVSLTKIANDLRWMNSGPKAGLSEIRLPDLQPGSSIMPGKVNPVICEVVVQVAAQVVGNDAAITFAGSMGNFELIVMLPVIGHNLLQQASLLSSSSRLLADKCVDGIEADAARCRSTVESTDILVTSLNAVIGYDRAAAILKTARATGRTIREVALDERVLPPEELDRVLDISRMTRGGIPDR
ncbi:MAG TPA: class II fumarate hydratase [Actinomycetota bacterium]|nr:class II fumarate hydratase [Actinomycetota bacterium]